MGFSRQEYWSGLPFPSPGHLFDPGIKLGSPALQADVFYHLSHQGTSRIETRAHIHRKYHSTITYLSYVKFIR